MRPSLVGALHAPISRDSKTARAGRGLFRVGYLRRPSLVITVR